MVQKVVNQTPAIGAPGQQVAFAQASYTPENYISDGTAEAGKFAFDATPETSGTAVQFPVASASGDRLLGLVERTLSAELPSHSEATNVYSEGENLTIATRGDYYIVAPAEAKKGQAVLVDSSSGAISFGEAGAENDTGWVVERDGASGETIIISKH